jgi:hypothetical protein
MAFLTMEDSTSCYVMWERRLLARFPCISPGLSARCTLPLNDPERPSTCPQDLSPTSQNPAVCLERRPRLHRAPPFGGGSPSRATTLQESALQLSNRAGNQFDRDPIRRVVAPSRRRHAAVIEECEYGENTAVVFVSGSDSELGKDAPSSGSRMRWLPPSPQRSRRPAGSRTTDRREP